MPKPFHNRFARGSRQQRGASMIEYALIVAAIVALGTALFATDGTGTFYEALKSKLTTVAGSL